MRFSPARRPAAPGRRQDRDTGTIYRLSSFKHQNKACLRLEPTVANRTFADETPGKGLCRVSGGRYPCPGVRLALGLILVRGWNPPNPAAPPTFSIEPKEYRTFRKSVWRKCRGVRLAPTSKEPCLFIKKAIYGYFFESDNYMLCFDYSECLESVIIASLAGLSILL